LDGFNEPDFTEVGQREGELTELPTHLNGREKQGVNGEEFSVAGARFIIDGSGRRIK
jgi:hypothetical protein